MTTHESSFIASARCIPVAAGRDVCPFSDPLVGAMWAVLLWVHPNSFRNRQGSCAAARRPGAWPSEITHESWLTIRRPARIHRRHPGGAAAGARGRRQGRADRRRGRNHPAVSDRRVDRRTARRDLADPARPWGTAVRWHRSDGAGLPREGTGANGVGNALGVGAIAAVYLRSARPPDRRSVHSARRGQRMGAGRFAGMGRRVCSYAE